MHALIYAFLAVVCSLVFPLSIANAEPVSISQVENMVAG